MLYGVTGLCYLMYTVFYTSKRCLCSVKINFRALLRFWGYFLCILIVFHINLCNQIGAIRWKWIPVFVTVWLLPINPAVLMERADSPETSVRICHITRSHLPEDVCSPLTRHIPVATLLYTKYSVAVSTSRPKLPTFKCVLNAIRLFAFEEVWTGRPEM